MSAYPGEASTGSTPCTRTPTAPTWTSLVKLVDGGSLTPALQRLRVGDLVEVDGPYGHFCLHEPEDTARRYVFLATGTGVAPFHSFIATYPYLRYKLIHGIRNPNEQYDAADYAPGCYVPCISRNVSGQPSMRLTDYLRDNPVDPDAIVYLCGNRGMIVDAFEILRDQESLATTCLPKSFFRNNVMKIAISYPPIINAHGQKAMVSQNRNVQYFKEPTYLLPVTYAQAATWLKQLGHDVYWDDGNAQLKTYDNWIEDLVHWQPEMVVLESTTPVMKFYWKTINQLKQRLPECVVVMTGYHSMRMPEETMQQSAPLTLYCVAAMLTLHWSAWCL
jgi:NAD(P)H-flavin reductase